jgi:hypothetical protein
MFSKYFRYVSVNYKAVLIFSIIVTACIAVIRFAALPQICDLHIQYGRIKETDGKLSVTGTDSVKTYLYRINKSLDSSSVVLFDKSGYKQDLSGLLRLIIDDAGAAGIRFVKIQPLSDTSKAATSVPLALEFTTTYNSMGKFISSIEVRPYLFHISRLSVTAIKNNLIEVQIYAVCFINSGPLKPEGKSERSSKNVVVSDIGHKS